MIKKLLLPLLILFVGCSDPLDEFIYSSGARICGQLFILGDSLKVNDTTEFVSYNEAEQSYSIECEDVGLYLLGSGTPTRQVIAIDKLTLSTGTENQIDSIAGRWRTLTSSGVNLLDSLRSSTDSTLFADSITYYQQTTKMLNDAQQIVYDIQSDFDEPHFRNPTGWSTENGTLLFSKTSGKRETIYSVSTIIE